MDPGPASSDVLYLQDEDRSTRIDASRVFSFLKLNLNIITVNVFYFY